MATNQTRKLNRSGNSHAGNTIRVISHGFYGSEKLSALERAVFNALYSFAQKGAAADFTYSEISRRYNISYATVARVIPKCLSLCFERGENQHSYKLKEILPAPTRYFYIPDWLRFAKFSSGTDLTNDQIEVLAYIIHQNKTLRNWTTTQASIARSLKIAPSTVSGAVALFEKLNILTLTCTDPTHSRCVNSYDRASFNLDYDILNKARLETLQHLKALSHAARDANARSDRERFYAARQSLAHEHEQKVRAQLGAQLENLERQIGLLEKQIAQAQHERRMQTVKEIYERRKQIKQALHDFLADNGYTEADLEPRFICPDCNDTGWLRDGKPCSSYTPPGGI